MNAKKLYKKLFKYFGPQGWWPIGGVYNPQKKSFSQKEKFEIMVGAILTQNTAWNNVEKALSNLRKEKYLDLEKISKTNLKKLQSLIKPSGFYKQKSVRLKNFAKYVLSPSPNTPQLAAGIKGRRTPTSSFVIDKTVGGGTLIPRGNSFTRFLSISREELLSLNGVGPETADSILLYALNKPYFVVDAYTKRFINRFGIFKGDKYEEIQSFFEKNIPQSTEVYKEYHALIVALAKNFCKKRPECENCPVMVDCKKM
ncbi:MAG: endonuclease [Elusimicrobia bacterium]|nr:endonuclease [Elusimicrobiota bacterium]